MINIKIKIKKWNDDPYCAKCGKMKANDGLSYRLLSNYPGVIMIFCNRCGYEWFMQCFPDE